MLDELAVRNGVWLDRDWNGVDPLLPLFQLAGGELESLLTELLSAYFREPAGSASSAVIREPRCAGEQAEFSELCGLPRSWSGFDVVRPVLSRVPSVLVKWDGEHGLNQPGVTVVLDRIRKDEFSLEEAVTRALLEYFVVGGGE